MKSADRGKRFKDQMGCFKKCGQEHAFPRLALSHKLIILTINLDKPYFTLNYLQFRAAFILKPQEKICLKWRQAMKEDKVIKTTTKVSRVPDIIYTSDSDSED